MFVLQSSSRFEAELGVMLPFSTVLPRGIFQNRLIEAAESSSA